MFRLIYDVSAPLVFADDSGHSRDLTAQNALKHDSSGALVGDASRENALSYDESGRLVAVTRMTPGGLAKTRYVYGADGARLAKLTVAPSFPAVYTAGIHSADNDFATMDDACAALRSVEASLPPEEIVLLHVGETENPVVHPAGSCLVSRSATEKKISAAALSQDADYRTRNFAIASATHYHPEVEIRETQEKTIVILEHPEGLGRTVAEQGEEQRPQSREIYIRDHLGNVRMTIADSLGDLSLMQSSDYTPYGRRIDVYSKDVETTPQFTGKEFDDESELYHFGARQYDPELGLWAQVDPGRQFASPYAYAGNGVNPINGVDPDGEKYVGEAAEFYEQLQKDDFLGSPTLKKWWDAGAESSKTIDIFWKEGYDGATHDVYDDVELLVISKGTEKYPVKIEDRAVLGRHEIHHVLEPNLQPAGHLVPELRAAQHGGYRGFLKWNATLEGQKDYDPIYGEDEKVYVEIENARK